MLKSLFKRLYLTWTAVLMALVTLLLGIIVWSNWQDQQSADNTYLSRMAALIIYQLEAESDTPQAILTTYDKEMAIAGRLSTTDGDLSYQSPRLTPAQWQQQSDEVQTQLATKTARAGEAAITQTEGIVKSSGAPHPLLLSARVVTKTGRSYELLLAYQGVCGGAFLRRQLPFVAAVWCLSLVVLALLHHRLLKKAFAPAEALLQSQKEFVAAASHELKSPLAVIMATVDALRLRTPLAPETDAALQTVDTECTRLAHLSQNLLTLATMDAGQWQIQKAPVDAEEVLIHLYDTYEPLCLRAGIQLSLLLTEAPLPTVISDRERLLQILSIFLDNAIHHAPQSGRIELQAAADAKALHLFVIDHGPGIAETDAPRIFDRFYRADRAHNDKDHVGLGLCIAKECAALLGAQIGHTPTPGGGATFFLALPLRG